MRTPLLRPLLALATAAALLGPGAALTATAAGPKAPSATDLAGDATVIAVIDSAFSPYHQDFLASKMPADARLPLTAAPHTWLPGFPKPSAFASYSPLKLTLTAEDDVPMKDLHDADQAQWDTVQESEPDAVRYRWIPGTKVIGALTFGDPEDSTVGSIYGTGGAEHGMGSASTSVGNVFGTCPQCLLVFIDYTTAASAEDALTWVHRQPWIDAVTNSYGMSTLPVVRDRVYNGTDVETEKAASERGQTTFFSSGNGLENAFTVPNSTLLSSQEGPDWVMTVGATDPGNDKDFTGTGKPADVAGIGHSYPTSYGSTTTSNGKDFSGTSNATPQVAGTYGRALWEARRALAGPSRTQAGGVVAKGKAVRCGAARKACELGDGRLTAAELRTRLVQGARPTEGGFTDGALGVVETPAIADTRFAAEGHGTYRGLLDEDWESFFSTRVLRPMLGRAPVPARPDGEVEWFRVDSACRQHIWGEWSGGYYLDEDRTPQPASDPVAWPTRTAIQTACPYLQPGPGPIL
ncbi:MAG: hypothetical protein EPN99_15700 [Frankiales bacterium]|nr:MAG: hypothetical protein EPN99_15700 [Frankiales bacterium]